MLEQKSVAARPSCDFIPTHPPRPLHGTTLEWSRARWEQPQKFVLIRALIRDDVFQKRELGRSLPTAQTFSISIYLISSATFEWFYSYQTNFFNTLRRKVDFSFCMENNVKLTLKESLIKFMVYVSWSK